MSVSSVSNGAPPIPPQSQNSDFRTAFQQLTAAITSGDLQGAQKAYASLQSLTQGSGQAAQGPMAQFLSTIGADLSAGKISTAQSDLTAFQKAHHHHHHAAASGDLASSGAPSADPDAAAAGSAPSSGSTPGSSNVLNITA